ncbi:hypothetical protein SmJEL517_g01100 [Synchytrium microbalum]|uniref:A-kinase anchor protein 7-like phosphoesterase domain-containing protein n=1 Tax=Synchytrium microbalum TaxID=1806994 RepID=A0A507CCP7_9FUNG|nr:uncharacterized protein SmJEL517_g01100 [Synchytrium microbalum]TPX36949.1 hypothetical protein SmJEL517_g01100 [Synchytrium microbalum]
MKSEPPTHFLSMRIVNPALNSNLQTHFYDKAIPYKNGSARNHLIPSSKFHITLFVFRISNSDDEEIALQCFDRCRNLINTHFQEPPILSFKGFRTFGAGRVIFANVEENAELNRLRTFRSKSHTIVCLEPQHFMNLTIFYCPLDDAYDMFKAAGLIGKDERDWTVHATVAKVQGKGGVVLKDLWHEQFADIDDIHLGTCTFESVELSCMQLKGEDGYYLPLSILPFNRTVV